MAIMVSQCRSLAGQTKDVFMASRQATEVTPNDQFNTHPGGGGQPQQAVLAK